MKRGVKFRELGNLTQELGVPPKSLKFQDFSDLRSFFFFFFERTSELDLVCKMVPCGIEANGSVMKVYHFPR